MPFFYPGASGDRLPPPHVVGGTVAVLAFGPPGAGRHVQGPSAGSGRARGSARNRSIVLPSTRRNRRECAWHRPTRYLPLPPAG